MVRHGVSEMFGFRRRFAVYVRLADDSLVAMGNVLAVNSDHARNDFSRAHDWPIALVVVRSI